MGNTATKVIVGAAIAGAGALIALSYSPNSDGDRRKEKEKEEAARNDDGDQKMKMKDKSAASGGQVGDSRLQQEVDGYWNQIPKLPDPKPDISYRQQQGRNTGSGQKKKKDDSVSQDDQRKKKKKELQSFAPEVNGYPYQIPQRPKPSSSYIQQQGVVKIMCYNIWNLEERKIQVRMKAISQLILQHSPDIILLQEVTPLVYKFFETCDWWTTYQCSVKPEKADRQIFCMQLSRLHVEKFLCKRLKNTTTGRGLCIARIKVGPNNNKKLTVATCHLKRPTDSDMYITERVGNAKEAISELHSEANVVFGGDMNWNEIFDGSFPLLGDWRDAWSVLRPTEDGWTYDTTTNRMMSHSRLRKSRLDRFFCKMNDFKMDSIERIGMEEIPGEFYEHNGEMLPILPSDHYGLLLTISPKVVNMDVKEKPLNSTMRMRTVLVGSY